MNVIVDNLINIRKRISNAAERSGRSSGDISLVAVTKNVSVDRINRAIEAGVTKIGENRVQEFREKKDKLFPVDMHMIGHLQTNKVKHAVELFSMIQSVDSFRLASEINKRCERVNRKMPLLLEINTSEETTKYGCQLSEAMALLTNISDLDAIEVRGLMTIGPFTSNLDKIRSAFQSLSNLAEKIKEKNIKNIQMDILSMGMSSDFEIAIEEGANMVRIGSAIFGPRLT
jgi:pyridoxal phosphate enzyme (YggS family)